MKYLILCLMSTICWGGDLPTHWADQEKKLVYYVPDYQMNLTLSKLEVDRQNYGQISGELVIDEQLITQQVHDLEKKYPGMVVKRVVTSTAGDIADLEIPLIGKKMSISIKNNNGNPYVYWTSILNKADYEKVKSGYEQLKVVLVANLVASVPMKTVVEVGRLPKSSCERLFNLGNDYLSVMKETVQLIDDIESQTYKYSDTLNSLKNKVIGHCLNLSTNLTLKNASDLMQISFKIPNKLTDLEVQTYRYGNHDKKIPLIYKLSYLKEE